MGELSNRGVSHLLVEGGQEVITSFLKEKLADEICIYIAPRVLGGSGSVDISQPMAGLAEAVGLYYVDVKRFGDDVRITGLLEKALDEISIDKD